jgi:hypothetical protein
MEAVMHPATKRFIEVLSEDVQMWKQAASNIDSLLPNIVVADREKWAATAEAYRKHAAEYNDMIEQTKADEKGR